jgi:hypothetical protein
MARQRTHIPSAGFERDTMSMHSQVVAEVRGETDTPTDSPP